MPRKPGQGLRTGLRTRGLRGPKPAKKRTLGVGRRPGATHGALGGSKKRRGGYNFTRNIGF